MEEVKNKFLNIVAVHHLIGIICGLLIYVLVFIAVLLLEEYKITNNVKLISFDKPECSITLTPAQYAVFEKYGLSDTFIEECQNIK